MSGDKSLSRKSSLQNLKEKIVKYYEAVFQVTLKLIGLFSGSAKVHWCIVLRVKYLRFLI